MASKITDYPAKTTFNDGDLYDVSSFDGATTYVSEKMTFTQLKANISTLYSADGSLDSARTVTLSATNTLTFAGGLTTAKGEDATSSNYAFKAQDSASADLFSVRNDGSIGTAATLSDRVHFTFTGNSEGLKLEGDTETVTIKPLGTSTLSEMNTTNAGFQFQLGTNAFRFKSTTASNLLFYLNGSLTGFDFASTNGTVIHSFYSEGANQGKVVLNSTGSSTGDFQVQGDTDANLIFSDASVDKVGIGTATPAEKLDVVGSVNATGVYKTNGTSGVASFTGAVTSITVTNGIVTAIS